MESIVTETAPIIEHVRAEHVPELLPQLAELLHACVHSGASVGFVLPFDHDQAETYWRSRVLPGVTGGGVVLLVARLDGVVVGTAQLDHDTPANQPHRAEVRKVLVHPNFRRRGIARTLMAEVERQACILGRTLLTLDTRTGDVAEPLYTSLGYQTTGVIPVYCTDALDPSRYDSTTIMYKVLGS